MSFNAQQETRQRQGQQAKAEAMRLPNGCSICSQLKKREREKKAEVAVE